MRATLIEGFQSQRADLLAVERGLDRLAPPASREAIADDLRAVERRLGDATFKLLVLGEYKRGKSTLINALLGRPLLPTAVVPLTSVVTEVGYGAVTGVTVELAAGRVLAIRPEELHEYVTEPGNPRNVKGVRRVLVEDPAPLLHGGVRIVDTPGVGSIYGHNTQATYGFLEEADAVVFVLAADQPPGAEEWRLLDASRRATDRILFVVNRTDLLSPEELESALSFARRHLSERGSAPPIHAVSARAAFEARRQGLEPPASFAAFEETLRRLLVDEKAHLLVARSAALLERTAARIALSLEAERGAAGMKVEALHAAQERFAAGADAARARAEEALVLLRHALVKLNASELPQAVDEAAARIHGTLWPRVESALARGDRPLLQSTRALHEGVGDWVVEEARDFQHDHERRVRQRLEEVRAEHEGRLLATLGQVVALANELLEMRASIPRPALALGEQQQFYYRDWDFAGGVLGARDALLLRLPRRWAEPLARARLAELLDRRVRQNLNAVRYDWVRRVEDALRQFEAASRRELESTVQLVERAMSAAAELRATAENQQALESRRVEETLRELEQLRAAATLAGEGAQSLLGFRPRDPARRVLPDRGSRR